MDVHFCQVSIFLFPLALLRYNWHVIFVGLRCANGHGSLVAKLYLTLVTLWIVACQAPLSMGFPRLESGVGCYFLLQRIFPTQGLNLGLLHCRWILYRPSYQGSPRCASSDFIFVYIATWLPR